MKYLKTQPHEDGGVGHQWMNWQLGAILAEKWNYKFIHSSLDSWRSGGSWDEYLGFGEDYLNDGDVRGMHIEDLPDLDYGFEKSEEVGKKNLKKVKRIIENGDDETIYRFPHSHFPGIVSKDLDLILSSLRKRYFKRHKDPTGDKFVVSLHLRRGDIDPNNNSNRWLSNEFYIHWIDFIKSVLDRNQVSYKIVLFSTTGRTGEFSSFQSFVDLRIDGDPFEDFNYMVYSNLLFSGLSSYSILAAALNRNFCVYSPLRTYTLWMRNKSKYISSYNDKNKEVEKWIKQIL